MELRHNELGSLRQIADVLWDEMLKEIERNGYSDLTFCMEGSARGIYEIIELNEIEDIEDSGNRIIDDINRSYE